MVSADADRTPLYLIAVQQGGGRPALHHRSELPCKVGRVVGAGVEPEAAGWREQVHRIASKKDTSMPVPVRDDRQSGKPFPDRYHFEFDVRPDRVANYAVHIQVAYRAVGIHFRQDHIFAFPVQGDEVGPSPGIDRPIVPGVGHFGRSGYRVGSDEYRKHPAVVKRLLRTAAAAVPDP